MSINISRRFHPTEVSSCVLILFTLDERYLLLAEMAKKWPGDKGWQTDQKYGKLINFIHFSSDPDVLYDLQFQTHSISDSIKAPNFIKRLYTSLPVNYDYKWPTL